MNTSLANHNDLQQQPPTRLLPDSFTRKKKLFSFLSERNTRPRMTSFSVPTLANTSSGDPPLDPSVTIPAYLDDTDIQFLRKSLSKFQNKIKQRQDILKQCILPWFRNKQQAPLLSTLQPSNLDQTRSILLRWWGTLLSHVQHINHNERGLYLDCLLEVVARPEFYPFDQTGCSFEEWYSSVEGSNMATRTQLEEYKRLLVSTLRYAIEKLNNKAIYSNMISFCAKILAKSFIKIPGVAVSLMQFLPVKNTIMRRLVIELGDLKDHNEYKIKLLSILPAHLEPMMTWKSADYKHHIRKTGQHQKLPISLTGNWIRRWKSDDSELFFSFYRHYHVTLKTYIMASIPSAHQCDLHQKNTILAVSPGYTHLAAYFAGKIDALLHRRLNSVTTSPEPSIITNSTDTSITRSPDSPIPPTPPKEDRPTGTDDVFLEPGDNVTATSRLAQSMDLPTLQLSQSLGKPRPLEIATQRYAECLVSCVIMAEPLGLFHDMINVWMRTMVKTTDRMAVESVFCLLDFIETVILEAQRTYHGLYYELPLDTYHQSILPLDIPFLLYTLQIILLQSDHSITLLRTLSFVYTHFDFLVLDSALLDYMCHRILLFTPIFERLFMHWSRNVRIFFARCLVWRVGRIWKTADVQWSSFAPLSATPHQNYTSPLSSIDTPPSGSVHATGCDGSQCWKAWHESKQDNDLLDYDKCALNAHIVLETMLESFQQRYSELNHDPSPKPRPDKIKRELPPTDHDSLLNSSPLPPYKSSTITSSTLDSLQQIRDRVQVHGKITYIAPQPIAKKKKWKRLFSFASPLPEKEDHTEPAIYYTNPWKPPPCTKIIDLDRSTAIHTAQSWFYLCSRHVYADKTMLDLQPLVYEYSLLSDNLTLPAVGQNRPIDPGAMDVPGLTLDWPKNWSYSQF